MSIGTKFYPSVIENHIYELMDDEKFIRGIELYSAGLEAVIVSYLDEANVEFQLMSSVHTDYDGESVYLSFIDDGHLHMISWEVRY